MFRQKLFGAEGGALECDWNGLECALESPRYLAPGHFDMGAIGAERQLVWLCPIRSCMAHLLRFQLLLQLRLRFRFPFLAGAPFL